MSPHQDREAEYLCRKASPVAWPVYEISLVSLFL